MESLTAPTAAHNACQPMTCLYVVLSWYCTICAKMNHIGCTAFHCVWLQNQTDHKLLHPWLYLYGMRNGLWFESCSPVVGVHLRQLSEHGLLLTERCEGDAPDNPDWHLQLQQWQQQQAHPQGLRSDEGLLWQGGDGRVWSRIRWLYSGSSGHSAACLFYRVLKGSFAMRRRSSSRGELKVG